MLLHKLLVSSLSRHVLWLVDESALALGHWHAGPLCRRALWRQRERAIALNCQFSQHALQQDAYANYLINQLEGPWAGLAEQWVRNSLTPVSSFSFALAVLCTQSGCTFPTPFDSCSAEWASESADDCCANVYVDVDGKRIPSNFALGATWPAVCILFTLLCLIDL